MLTRQAQFCLQFVVTTTKSYLNTAKCSLFLHGCSTRRHMNGNSGPWVKFGSKDAKGYVPTKTTILYRMILSHPNKTARNMKPQEKSLRRNINVIIPLPQMPCPDMAYAVPKLVKFLKLSGRVHFRPLYICFNIYNKEFPWSHLAGVYFQLALPSPGGGG